MRKRTERRIFAVCAAVVITTSLMQAAESILGAKPTHFEAIEWPLSAALWALVAWVYERRKS